VNRPGLVAPIARPVLRSPPVTDLFAILGLGFFLGMRHATDPDHVVAVTTIVSRERTVRAAVAIGLLWGLGHTATIIAVGGAIVLFGVVIPPRLGLSMEMAVALLLVVLGAMNLTGALRNIREHAHGAHSHPHSGRASLHGLGRAAALRPLLIGLVHGLAGSAAVSLLVLAAIHDARWAVVYLVVFGIGTVVGMMLLTLGMAGPLARASAISPTVERRLVRATGLVSLAFGLFLAYRIGVADGLLVGVPHWTPR